MVTDIGYTVFGAKISSESLCFGLKMDKYIGKKETEKCKFHQLTGGLPETTSTHKKGTINHRPSDYVMHKIHSKHPKIASDISKSKKSQWKTFVHKKTFFC